jgi:hypothetical protein
VLIYKKSLMVLVSAEVEIWNLEVEKQYSRTCQFLADHTLARLTVI